MLYKNLLIFTAISAYFLPILTVRLTINNEKAREIFYQKKTIFGHNNAYNECYNILRRDPSLHTYNCRIIAEHLYQAEKHAERAREYHKNDRQATLSDIEIINKEIATCLNVQNKMEADLRDKKRYRENEKRRLEKKDALYNQSYWQTLSDRDKEDLEWALKDGKLSNKIDEEMERIQKDLENKK